MKLGVVQMNVCENKTKNLKTAAESVKKLAKQGAEIVVLPEMFCCPYENAAFVREAETEGGMVTTALSQMARENRVILIGGSMPEQADGKLYNTSFVYDADGTRIARHRKAHLFDINVPNGQVFCESDTFTAGEEMTVFETNLGTFGLCICFDMRFPLSEFTKDEYKVGDTIDGICYRFAREHDAQSVFACTDAAYEEFTQYYKNDELYRGNGAQNPKVLVATDGDEVVGTLFVNLETEGFGIGSVGCTTVKPSHQGRHIGVNMVTVGTKYLKDAGMKEAYLGYTYTGLDHMYGYAGYKVCIYYMMAKKAR